MDHLLGDDMMSTSGSGEGCDEGVNGGLGIAAGEGLEGHRALVSHVAQCSGDGGVVDLTGAGFAPSGHIGHLDLPDLRQ